MKKEKSVARYLVGPYNNSWNFMDAGLKKRRMEIPSSLKWVCLSMADR